MVSQGSRAGPENLLQERSLVIWGCWGTQASWNLVAREQVGSRWPLHLDLS